jgi:hypothetical protein
MAFRDLLRDRCTIYRLSGIDNYNFSTSEEGEVTEVWGTVAANVPCLYDHTSASVIRRSDGLVHNGAGNFFTSKDSGLITKDRLLLDDVYYTVEESDTTRGIITGNHHIQAKIEVIDWNGPPIPTIWEDPITPYSYDFTYQTTSPMNMYSILIGQTVSKISIDMSESFDDPAAYITVGYTGSETYLLDPLVNLLTGEIYMSELEITFSLSAQLKLYIHPGASTQGAGTILLDIRRSP